MTSSSPPPEAASGLPAVLAPLVADMGQVEEAYRHIVGDVAAHSRGMIEGAATFQGKRLRPGLTVVAGRLAGGRTTPEIAQVAAIVELIHTATLVHDDILDGADVRRTTRTLNTEHGNQAAVLAGDVLFSKAYRAAAWMEDPYASRYLADVVGEVLEGEIHQDQVVHTPDLSEATYRTIIRGKTASLYEAALRVGAHYGGASPDLADALAAFGHHLGMAFQIIDDHLDLAGDEARVGKSLGTDLREGKTTLPMILWRDAHADPAAARAAILAAWHEPAAAQALIARLREDGAFTASRGAAEREIGAARSHLATLPEGLESQVLHTVADYVLSRTR